MKKIIYNKEDLENKQIFFTSDLHFRHGNIIKFCNRPFSSIQEMDDQLIQNWNNKVIENDIVFILGDFAFANKNKWRSILNILNGSKYLILGNHDYETDIPIECFITIEDMLQVSIQNEELDGYTNFILTHYPLATWAGINKVVVNIHGHIHSTPDLNGTGFDIHIAKNAPWNQYDIGVDRNNFEPVSYSELKIILTRRMLYGINEK